MAPINRFRFWASLPLSRKSTMAWALGALVATELILVSVPPSLGQVQISEAAPLQNSTRKIRIEPSIQSRRVGTAVEWQPDFESALAKSRETNKPIFWYVPTVRGTFMDRKSEIDRYMLAGPFSWPAFISELNQRFVPVRTPPTQLQQAKYELVQYKFIEPGFLILKPNGTASLKVDRLTTLHIGWLHQLLSKHGGSPVGLIKPSKNMARFSRGEFEELSRELESRFGTEQASCADDLIYGMSLFRLGRHAEATKAWQLTSQRFPHDPLGWKAAAEAEKIGPFVRGFEIHRRLPQPVYQFEPINGSTAPRNSYSPTQVRLRGIEFLLGMQAQDGGFRDSDYDFGGTDSLPNVHVAVTALAGNAMLQELERDQRNQVMEQGLREDVVAAVKSAIQFVADDSKLNKFDRDEILWAYAYRLRFLVQAKKLIQTTADKAAGVETDAEATTAFAEELGLPQSTIDQHIVAAIEALESVQSRRGSWYHEYNNPFVTATALLALFEAHDAGARVDTAKVSKGLASLARDRFADGAFPYGSSQVGGNQDMRGGKRELAASAGRMPLCELGLWHWGKSSDAALDNAIENSFRGQGNLNRALKYDDHTSALGYGGFFFWYDMRARSEAIAQVTDVEAKKAFAKQQRAIIMSLPEIDGCFVDSHELGRVYGTSMALLSLDLLE